MRNNTPFTTYEGVDIFYSEKTEKFSAFIGGRSSHRASLSALKKEIGKFISQPEVEIVTGVYLSGRTSNKIDEREHKMIVGCTDNGKFRLGDGRTIDNWLPQYLPSPEHESQWNDLSNQIDALYEQQKKLTFTWPKLTLEEYKRRAAESKAAAKPTEEVADAAAGG